jgi:hypothetical protein
MRLRFWNDPATGLPLARQSMEGLPPCKTEEEEMKRTQHLPAGWTENEIRELPAHHDNQTEEEQAVEIEAALSDQDQTVMVVPTKLVPQILRLIQRKQTA